MGVMKKILVLLITGFVLIMAHDLNGVYAADGGGGGIPLSKLAGGYSITDQGTATLCLNPKAPGTESCTTAGAVPVVLSAISVGQFTEDKDGNACGSWIQAASITGDVHPPTPAPAHFILEIKNYDAATGSGDQSLTFYVGGTCTGSKFDNTGATVSTTGTSHIVASDHRKRVDSIVTTITDAAGDIGAFNLATVALKQKD